MSATILFDTHPEPTASGGDLYALNTKYDYEPLKYDYQPLPTTAAKHNDPWYAPEPSTTTKAETGYTFYPIEDLAAEQAKSTIFLADVAALCLAAGLLYGLVLIGRDIVGFIRSRKRRSNIDPPSHA